MEVKSKIQKAQWGHFRNLSFVIIPILLNPIWCIYVISVQRDEPLVAIFKEKLSCLLAGPSCFGSLRQEKKDKKTFLGQINNPSLKINK